MHKVFLFTILYFSLAFLSLSVQDIIVKSLELAQKITRYSYKITFYKNQKNIDLSEQSSSIEEFKKSVNEYFTNVYNVNLKMQLFVFFISLALYSIYTSFDSQKRKETKRYFAFLKELSDMSFQRLWDELDREGTSGIVSSSGKAGTRLKLYGFYTNLHIFLASLYTFRIPENNFFLAAIFIAANVYLAIMLEKYFRFRFIFNNFYSMEVEKKIKELNKYNYERKIILSILTVFYLFFLAVLVYYVILEISYISKLNFENPLFNTPIAKFFYFIFYEFFIMFFKPIPSYLLLNNPVVSFLLFTLCFLYVILAQNSFVFLKNREDNFEEEFERKMTFKQENFFFREEEAKKLDIAQNQKEKQSKKTKKPWLLSIILFYYQIQLNLKNNIVKAIEKIQDKEKENIKYTKLSIKLQKKEKHIKEIEETIEALKENYRKIYKLRKQLVEQGISSALNRVEE